jgi:hypothetical protein
MPFSSRNWIRNGVKFARNIRKAKCMRLAVATSSSIAACDTAVEPINANTRAAAKVPRTKSQRIEQVSRILKQHLAFPSQIIDANFDEQQ